MINHPHNDEHLDQVVKEALEGYEAPFDASSWAEMEKTLGAAPKTFQSFKQWSFSLNTIIAIVALVAGALIFKFSLSGAEANTAVSQTPAVTAPAEQKPQPVTSVKPPQPETAAVASATEEISPEENEDAPQEVSPAGKTAGSTKPKKQRANKTRNPDQPSENGEYDFMQAAGQDNGSATAQGGENSTAAEEGAPRPFNDYIVGGSNSSNTDPKKSPDLIFPGEKNYNDETGKKGRKGVRWPKIGSKKQDQGSNETQASENTTSTEKSDTSKTKPNRERHQPQYKADRTIFER